MNYQNKIDDRLSSSSSLTDNILVELLEKHFQLLQDTLGGINADFGEFLPLNLSRHSRDLAYTLEIKLLEVGAQKELTKARLENLNAVVGAKYEETISLVESSIMELDKVNNAAEERDGILHPDKQDTLSYTLVILREKLAHLKEVHAKLNIVDTAKMQDLVKKHENLLIKDSALSARLAELSSKGTLPPNFAKAEANFEERKEYLGALKHQILSLQNASTDISSVFGDSKFH